MHGSPFVTQYPDNKRGVPCQGGAAEEMVGFRLQWRSGSAAARRLPKPPLIASSFRCTIFSDMVCRLFSECLCGNFHSELRSANRVFFYPRFHLHNLLDRIDCIAVVSSRIWIFNNAASGNPSVSIPPGLFSCGIIPTHPYPTLEMTGLWCYDNRDTLGGMWHAQADRAPLGPVIDST